MLDSQNRSFISWWYHIKLVLEQTDIYLTLVYFLVYFYFYSVVLYIVSKIHYGAEVTAAKRSRSQKCIYWWASGSAHALWEVFFFHRRHGVYETMEREWKKTGGKGPKVWVKPIVHTESYEAAEGVVTAMHWYHVLIKLNLLLQRFPDHSWGKPGFCSLTVAPQIPDIITTTSPIHSRSSCTINLP